MTLSDLDPSAIAAIGFFSVPIVTVIAYFWHASIKVKAENELKKTMVEQGRSPEEIERVLAMRSGKKS